jgi:hypothetical protein
MSPLSSKSKAVIAAKSTKPSMTSNIRYKSSVSFAPNAQLRLYRCKMTQAERDNYYYSDQDYENFKEEALLTIEMIGNKTEIDEVKHCARGVICRTPDALRRRISFRLKAWDAVFTEQERQWRKEGEHAHLNAEAIAAAYVKHCYSSKRLAYTIAKCDEKAVAAFNANNNNNNLIVKRRMEHPHNTSNIRTHATLNSMSVVGSTSRQLATTAA